MSKILVMDMSLANLIAAGEVVERPASVVKELVENALDAEADTIVIEVEQAGLKSIRVTDNGTGMDKDDLKLALLRHATSKIIKADDLTKINTLGFRGEALPSIAAVSNIKLSSRTKSEDGYFVSYENNKLVAEGRVALNVGTVVEVFDLFFNTPARFKYLRSEYTEKAHIVDLVDKLCLSHPHVSFRLIMDGKEVRHSYGKGSIEALINHIYGNEATKGLKHFETSIAKIKVNAYLVNPSFVRSKRNDISIFINNRYIRNYAISQSVIDGYSSYIMTKKYPIALIYITIDPHLVDVNVHPQKMEVKLANEMVFSYALTTHIKDALHEGSMPIREVITDPIKKDAIQIDNLFDLTPNQNIDVIHEKAEISSISSIKFPPLEYIGTYLATYLIFQGPDGMYLMDQHAAAERIRYEYYEEKVGMMNAHSFNLLVPRPLKISKLDMDLIHEHKDALKTLGFDFMEHALISHPVWLRSSEIDVAVEAMVDQLRDFNVIDLKRLRNQLAKDIACKGAIKANHQLSRKEIDVLVQDLGNCKNPYTCPHGRPVMIKITPYEIEKMFKRIV